MLLKSQNFGIPLYLLPLALAFWLMRTETGNSCWNIRQLKKIHKICLCNRFSLYFRGSKFFLRDNLLKHRHFLQGLVFKSTHFDYHVQHRCRIVQWHRTAAVIRTKRSTLDDFSLLEQSVKPMVVGVSLWPHLKGSRGLGPLPLIRLVVSTWTAAKSIQLRQFLSCLSRRLLCSN